MPKDISIAVLISGGGTTLKNLITRCDRDLMYCSIDLVVSSSPKAGGLKYAEEANIPSKIVQRKEFGSTEAFSEAIFEACRAANIELVVMGGFLKRVKIPADFENKVINIHPSLIPSFCGKGNYGLRVHTNVIEYGAKISGCTVHFVDDQYDHGPIIAQETVPVLDTDEPEDLAKRVFAAETELYPKIINAIALGQVKIEGRKVSMLASAEKE